MKPKSVLLAGFVSALALAGCASYDDEEEHHRYRSEDDARYYTHTSRDSYPHEERGRYSALELYTQPDFRGSTMKFDRDGTSLDSVITGDGIGSVIVREGRWELCSGGRFQGYCRTFEPGRYERLGRLEGAPIGSLRRLS